ncbi:MAG: hypothetical protein K9G30_00920 [Parvibaculum sp.]|nr:hypothetical protein [Parvibaculum sp.]
MTNQMQKAPTRKEGIVTRYSVDVGEEFPLSEEERREGERSRYDHECRWSGENWHAEWHRRRDEAWEARRMEMRGRWRHGRFRAPRLLVVFAVIALGVALISTAASYPLATLAIAALALLFARDHCRGRRSFDFRDWAEADDYGSGRRDRRDAA